MTTIELEKALETAYSIESMAGHNAEERSIEYIGMVEQGKRVKLIYKDEKGVYWYKTMFVTEKGLITQHEYIFGKPEKKKPQRWPR